MSASESELPATSRLLAGLLYQDAWKRLPITTRPIRALVPIELEIPAVDEETGSESHRGSHELTAGHQENRRFERQRPRCLVVKRNTGSGYCRPKSSQALALRGPPSRCALGRLVGVHRPAGAIVRITKTHRLAALFIWEARRPVLLIPGATCAPLNLLAVPCR